MTKKITFKGGWWADMRESWSYGSDSKIAGAWAFADDAENFGKATVIHLQESVIAAHLPDTDGNAIPFSAEMWPQVDGRIARHLLRVSRDMWREWQQDMDPKDIGQTSSASPQD